MSGFRFKTKDFEPYLTEYGAKRAGELANAKIKPLLDELAAAREVIAFYADKYSRLRGIDNDFATDGKKARDFLEKYTRK